MCSLVLLYFLRLVLLAVLDLLLDLLVEALYSLNAAALLAVILNAESCLSRDSGIVLNFVVA